MERSELIELVDKIKNCCGTEEEIDDMIILLQRNLICPYVIDLIFYDEKTPEEIVDEALKYNPIQL